jgi:hypothetical protein
MVLMDYERLSTKTADDLANIRALDFARLVGLQMQFRDDPNRDVLALRNFPVLFPRSMNVDLFTKAAVSPMTSTDSTAAGPLAIVRPLLEGFIQLVRASALIGKLGLRRVPMLNASLPVETTSATFTWIGEGLPKPMAAGAYATLAVASAKAAGYITLTEELDRFMGPENAAGLRDVLVKGVQLFVDTEFCDQTIASTTARPGGLANGSPTAAASGTTEAACATDVKASLNAFVAVNPSLEDARIVMSPNTAIPVAIATKSTTLLATGGSLYGVPVVTTAAIGNKILFFDASQVVYGDDPAGVRIDLSRQATIQFDSTPSDPTTASDVFLATWQRGLVAFKVEYPIRWKLARTNAARTLTGVAYA